MVHWEIWASLATSVLGFVILQVGYKLINAKRVPRHVADWLPVLEQLHNRVINANTELATAVKALAVAREEMPSECQKIADQVLYYSQIVEETTYEELAQRGIVPRYIFGGPVSDMNRPVADVVPAATTIIDAETVHEPLLGGERKWVNGQMLRLGDGA